MTAVLVIEDDDRIRLSLVLALEDEGYAATGAATAEEGLHMQRRDPADTVLVDSTGRSRCSRWCFSRSRS